MVNVNVDMTLDECVNEVLGMLTGLELRYEAELDRYRAVVRAINRALRANARDHEWAYYTADESIGTVQAGVQDVTIRPSLRPRIIGDDSVRLCEPTTGKPLVWAYFLPRDAIEKYPARRGLWVAITRSQLHFSRPFFAQEAGLDIRLPVMREPRLFRLPEQPTGAEEELVEVPAATRQQLLDFEFPDAVLARAAYYYAQTDPIMQPRVQTLESEYKDIYYALTERDSRHTDSPFLNEWTVPIQGDVTANSYQDLHHPHADERY